MSDFTPYHSPGKSTQAALLTANAGATARFLRHYDEGAMLQCVAATALMRRVPTTKGGNCKLIQETDIVSICGLHSPVASATLVSSSDEEPQLAKKLGAQHLVNHKRNPYWVKAAPELTNGEGADRIAEVGGQGTLAKSFACIKYHGITSSIGFVAELGEPVNAAMLALGRAAIMRGILVRSREQFESWVKLFQVAGVRPIVDKVFAFDEAKEAYRYLESQQHVGKVVIKID